MIATALMQIVVTVFVAGQPPVRETLPTLYPVTNNACEARASAIKAHALKGTNVTVECVSTDNRNS